MGLIDGAYAAALDETLWESWTANLIIALGGAGGTFSVLDSRTSAIRKMIPLGWSKVESDYLAHWGQFDPLVPAVVNAPRTMTFVDTDHVNLEDRNSAAYMHWQRSEADLDHHLGASIHLGDSALRAGISIHRWTADGHTPASEQRKLSTILPEVFRAVQLGFRHNEMLLDSFWEGLTTTTERTAAILLDDQRKVTRLNQAADDLLKMADGITVRQDRLVATSARDDDQLQAIIRRATYGPQVSGALQLQRRFRRSPYILIVYPFARSNRVLAPYEAAALVRIVDPNSLSLGSSELYKEAFGFTPRETQLATLLAAGHSLESATAVMGISIATGRTFVRHLLEKTSTSNQANLIRLLANIG
jgi:DNA-binding CsgD family transcriptional regulator